MNSMHMKRSGGFTLIELLVVIGIIGVLASVVLIAVSDTRENSRDARRGAQMQEYLKALELYYSENGDYPTPGGPYPVALSAIEGALQGGGHISSIPVDDDLVSGDSRYQYCTDGDSFMIAVNTEDDGGGSEYCHAIRGPGTHGCVYSGGSAVIDADDPCTTRF